MDRSKHRSGHLVAGPLQQDAVELRLGGEERPRGVVAIDLIERRHGFLESLDLHVRRTLREQARCETFQQGPALVDRLCGLDADDGYDGSAIGQHVYEALRLQFAQGLPDRGARHADQLAEFALDEAMARRESAGHHPFPDPLGDELAKARLGLNPKRLVHGSALLVCGLGDAVSHAPQRQA